MPQGMPQGNGRTISYSERAYSIVLGMGAMFCMHGPAGDHGGWALVLVSFSSCSSSSTCPFNHSRVLPVEPADGARYAKPAKKRSRPEPLRETVIGGRPPRGSVGSVAGSNSSKFCVSVSLQMLGK